MIGFLSKLNIQVIQDSNLFAMLKVSYVVDYIGVQGASSVESQHYDSSTDKILPDFEGLKPNECYKKAGIQFTCAPFLPYGIGNCNIPTEFIYDSSSQNKKITKYYLRVGFTHRKDQFDQYASFNIKVNNNQVQPTKKEEKGCDNYKWTIIFLQYNLEEQLYKISITISTNLPQNVNYSISDIVFIVDFTPNCDQSCKTCSGLSQNQCIICKDKKYISVRLGNICTDICDVNKTEFEDALTNKDQKYCRQCLTSCKTCSKQNTCDSCFEKQFLDSNNLCSPCHPDCQTCVGWYLDRISYKKLYLQISQEMPNNEYQQNFQLRSQQNSEKSGEINNQEKAGLDLKKSKQQRRKRKFQSQLTMNTLNYFTSQLNDANIQSNKRPRTKKYTGQIEIRRNSDNNAIQKDEQISNQLFSSRNLSKLLGGGGVCFSSSSKKNEVDNPSKKQKNIRQIHNLKNDEYFKETSNQNQQIEEKESNIEGDIDDFSNAYKQYFNKNALAKTASGFLSIAGAIKGIVEIKLEDFNKFIQEVKDIFKQLSGSQDSIQSLGDNANQLYDVYQNDSIDFSIKKMKKFDQKIINFDCQSSYLLVQLDDDKNYYGRFEQGLKEVDFLGQFAKLSKNCVFIAASIENQLIIYQVNNQFQRFKTLDNHSDYINSIEFSDDGKLMISTSNKELILWSLEKNYEQIKIIQDSEIESVAISRDGKYIATGYIDKFYKIWQRKEEEIALIEEVQYEKNQLLSVAFDEKKDIVALGSKINCRVYDIQTKLKKMQIIEGHSQRISSVVFSPNGQYLATGSVDSTCKIWKIISNQNFMLFKVLEGHSGEVCSVTFSSDNKYLATSSQDKTVKIWELERQFQLIHTLQDHSLQVTQLAFSNDNKYLATVSYDKTCRIWSCQKDFHIVKIIQDYTRELTTVAFSGDSKYLATGSYEKTCKIFDVERDFTIIKTLQDHTSIIAQVKFSKDGRYLATCSYDNTCKIWSVKKQFHLIKTIDGHKERVYQISFSEDSKYLASGSMDGTCKVWDVDKQFKLVNSIQHEGEEVTSVSFSYDNQQLAISSFNILNIYNAQNRIESINEIEGHTQEITSVAFSNNGKYIATSSLDQTCKIWNIENGFYLQKTIQDHTDMITCIAFSNNDKYFATTSFDQTCRIWDIQKGFEQINLIQGETNLLFCVAFSPDSKYLAIGYMDYYCQVFDINQGFKLNHTLQDEACSVASLSFSSDGKYFSIGSDDNTCKIWDSSNNFSLLHTMQDHESVVNSVCFSPDCKYFVTGCLDKTFKIWNIQKDFQLIHTIHREESGNNEIILSSFYIDSRHLLTCSQGNICEVWDVEQNFKLVNIIEENNTEINQISISSDGNYLAIAFQDSTCKLLDAKKAFQQIYSQNLNSAGLIQQKECEPKKSQIKQHKGQNFFENIYTF
ncbi:hypothetical protein ABPG74_003039 [Tetrahymena malaccensis]